MSEIERRALSEGVKVRSADGEAPTVSGYAALFNTETVIAGFFREQIAPGAFKTAIKSDDVRALFNHDPNYVLGRTTNDTLTLKEDKRGLFYDVTLNPDDPEAMSVRAKIQRGDVTGSSFGFSVEKEEWEEPKTARDLPLRTITRATLFDVSPVTYPAYPTTTVSARSHAEAAIEAAKVLAAHEETADVLALRAQVDAAKAWRT